MDSQKILNAETSGSMGHTSQEMMEMSSMNMMTISWGTDCLVLLFQTFHADTKGQFILCWIAVLLIAVLSQILHLPSIKKFVIGRHPRILDDGSQTPILPKYQGNTPTERAESQQDKQQISIPEQKDQRQNTWISQTFWRAKFILFSTLTSLLSLFVMLFAMSMNGYIIIAVALGTAIGKLISVEIQTNHKNNPIDKMNGQKKYAEGASNHCV